MAKKGLEVARCELCDTNAASYSIKLDTDELLLCSPCKVAYEQGQEHPDAVVEPMGQEDGIDEDIFEEEGSPSKDDDQAGDGDD